LIINKKGWKKEMRGGSLLYEERFKGYFLKK